MTQMTKVLGILAVIGLTSAAADAATLVYEGFDYAVGSDVNSPLTGGLGFAPASQWTAGQQGGVITVYDAASAVGVTNNNAGGEIEWDGVVDNVPTSPTPNRYIGTGASNTADRITAERLLSDDAGTLAGVDNVLWASVVWHMQGTSFGRHVSLVLGTDGVSNRSANLDTSGNHGAGLGNGLGVGGSFNSGLVTPVFYDGGAKVLQTTSGATGVASNKDNLVVLKFIFADGAGLDTIEAYTFTESAVLSEATFNTNAVSASRAIDQSTLNILGFSQSRGKEAIDEIRLGDSFDDVIQTNLSGSEVPEPASLAMGLVGLSLMAARRRRG